ncbi:MAG: micrococcal nuclease [Lentisphaerae bacterium]|nr:micrococcal nuclease [Lentisphaerota bacterium]
MNTPRVILPFALSALLAGCVWAQSIEGRVVGVHDGDTLTVLDADKVQHKVRLAGIDAPEKKQAFGEKAKLALSGKVFGKPVNVAVVDTDRYGRTVGDVYCGTNWINREMVVEGWAWHYKAFSKSKELAAAEEEASAAKRGLWADRDPIAPWQFRASERGNR